MTGRETGRPRAVSQPLAAVVEYETKGCLFATWKNVLIAVWAAQATPALVAELSQIAIRYADADDRTWSMVNLVVHGAPLAGAEAREGLKQLTERFGTRLACVATMIEGSGFWASATRSLLTSLLVVGRRTSYKSWAFETTLELATWLAEMHPQATGVNLNVEELRVMLEALITRPSILAMRPA